ncbi:MAG: protein kinase [Oscillospiraceae bacterium]|nr:protein kinase [Oscillospiraceae bacterium]
MVNPVFEPEKALGAKLTQMDRQELCSFVSALCRAVVNEVGSRGRRGGIYPENISTAADGSIALGPAGKSPWEGQELDFVAPELYWNGQLSAASDVYSVGMLMYYALSGGKLPLEDEGEDAQQRRMAGGNPRAPQNAGKRLGAIIEKSIRFKASERYQTLEELRAVVDSCVRDLYLGGVSSAEAIFKKAAGELSDVERMMVGIIDCDEDEAIASADEFPLEPPEDGVKVYNPAQKGGQKEIISAAQAQMLSQKLRGDSPPAAPKRKADDVLTPVTLERSSPAVQYKLKTDRERKIAEEVKKRRRRPLAVILVLCAVLVMVAIIMNAMLKDFEQARSQTDNQLEPAGVDPYSATMAPTADDNGYPISQEDFGAPMSGPSVTMEPVEIPEIETPKEHEYKIFKDDVSWTDAQKKCEGMGGHLVVIENAAELEQVIAMAEAEGISRVWIGCHRGGDSYDDPENRPYLWEGKDPSFEGYFRWAKGEPTYVDNDDTGRHDEDYIMLWDHNGWAYNDNRDDPCHDYPEFYSGTMGYVCEFND